MRDKAIVRAGYETVAEAYARERDLGSEDIRLLTRFVGSLPPGSRVLDAGCGGGAPAAAFPRTSRVVGIDFARAQIRLLRNRVPSWRPVLGDMTCLPFRAESFDAVVSLYAVIHVPREEHGTLLREFHRVLRAPGRALLCLGETDLPRDVAEYMGARMFWSHYDAETNRRLLQENGFAVLDERSVADFQVPSARHRFFTVAKVPRHPGSGRRSPGL